MRRTEQLQGLRLMKFEDVYGRCYRGDLSQAEASEILGMSERTFRRWRERYEAEGAEGLYDRRLGRVSARRAPVDEVMRVLELFETRYPDFTAKHFHEKLVCEHGFGLSYNWLRLSLQAHGKIKPAPRRGAHRRKRPRRPVVGMMLHQDGSSHEWVAGQWWDLIVTMDDATSEVYSGFFVAEEGTMSTFRGLGEVIAENGLFCSLYADRASHYWHTPEAGGGVDKDNPTQVGRALAQLGIELIAAYSPQARGRSERMFGTLQKRLPQELRLAGIATMAEANRFLEELFWPAHNARFARPAADTGSAFVAFAGTLEDILCVARRRRSFSTWTAASAQPTVLRKARPTTGTSLHLLSSPVPVQPVRRFGTVRPASRQRSQRRWLAQGAGAGSGTLQGKDLRRYFRGDAAFASPDIYKFLEDEGFLYAIRLRRTRRIASSRATTPCATRTARCRSRPIATATTTSRRRSGCTNIPTATWPSSTDPGVWRATAPTAKPSTTTGSRPRDPLRRDRARACG